MWAASADEPVAAAMAFTASASLRPEMPSACDFAADGAGDLR